MNEYYLTCPRGLEETTCLDISTYLDKPAIPDKGGVFFSGSLKDMYTVNLYSRTGMFVLKKLFFLEANNYNELYKKILDFPWKKILDSEKTFSIRSKINSDIYTNSNFTTLKIKDGIVDSIKKQMGVRPSIDRYNPDIKFFVFINNNKIKIYLDSSGNPLFMRGYRAKIHKAALNESLAAGLVLHSNWNKKDNFYDIMCGSGTIPIEAAMIAFNIPPRILRDEYAFKKWDNYNCELWESVKKNAKSNIDLNNKILLFKNQLL